MNQTQENIAAMFDATANYLEKHRSVWSSFKALADAFGELQAGIAAIDTLGGRQQATLKGYTGDKAQVRGELEEALAIMVDALGAYGAMKKDPQLRASMNLGRSHIGHLTTDNLEECARKVVLEARHHLPALADFRIDEAKVAALDALREHFSAIKQDTRSSQASRTAATLTLPELIAETRTLLRERLDRLVSMLIVEQPVFVAGYRSVRVVVRRPATHSVHGEELGELGELGGTGETSKLGERTVAREPGTPMAAVRA